MVLKHASWKKQAQQNGPENVSRCRYFWNAGGKLQHIKDWWDGLTQLGPQYGYFPNPKRTSRT